MTKIVACVGVSCLMLVFPFPAGAQCTDVDGDGYYRESGCGTAPDCNDASSIAFPGAPELCDGADNDCNGQLDDDLACDRTCDLAEVPGSETGIADSGWDSLVWTGSEYGLAWETMADEIYFTRLDESGTRIGADVRVTDDPAVARVPSLVWTGSEFGVSWYDARDGNHEIYFARLDATGAKLGVDLRVTTDGGASRRPSLVWTGSEYGLAWIDDRDGSWAIHFARLDASGNKIGSDLRVTDATAAMPSLVWTGSEYGLAWQDDRDGNSEIYFARLDASGSRIGSDVRLTDDPAWSGYPTVVWQDTRYGVAWTDSRDGHYEIYFVPVDASGAKIGSDVRITSDPLPSKQPSLAWTGVEYGLGWSKDVGSTWNPYNFEIYFARLDPSGNLIGSEMRLVYRDDEPSEYTRIVWTGSGFGVTFLEWTPDVYFVRVGCNCIDADNDGTSRCNDCDDDDDQTFPDAEQLCDGVNNDCSDPSWPAVPSAELDADSDAFAVCEGDCDDDEAAVFPDATELCDGLNNDCNDPLWPQVPADEIDADGDTFRICAGDCNDGAIHTFPGAPQLCDGINNDCSDGNWPIVPADEADDDSDGYRICEGDCDDTRARINPDGRERCNDTDDDCDGLTDEDENGEDTDSDTVANLCDNCPAVVNPNQTNSDTDEWGDACDNCDLVHNPEQPDFDADDEGDHCDVNDGSMCLYFDVQDWLDWDAEEGFDAWNAYHGDLDVLRIDGWYTQEPGSNPLAGQHCGLSNPFMQDDTPEMQDKVVFFLVTGMAGSVESGLGTDGGGTDRTNANPCPQE